MTRRPEEKSGSVGRTGRAGAPASARPMAVRSDRTPSAKEGPSATPAAAVGLRYQRAPGVVMRRVAGEVLLVPARRRVADLAAIFALNETGEVVWEMVERPCSASAIGLEIARRFDVEEGVAVGDCRRMLDRLEREHLVVPVT